MKTTLNKIRKFHPCADGWKKLLKYLNKTQEDDEELDIREIIKSNGIEDAVWCLRAVDEEEKVDLFNRRVALINIESIKPYTDNYDLIVRFLETGDKSIRKETEKAATDAYIAASATDDYAAAYTARAAANAAAWDQVKEVLIKIAEEE